VAEDKQKINTDCQLQVIYESGQKPVITDRIRHIFLRLSSAFRRRAYGIANTADSILPSGPGVGFDSADVPENDSNIAAGDHGRASFNSGEIVTIRPFEEILKTLDPGGRCDGLQFMPGMKKYCGRQARVLKRVRLIFDERLWKMVKTRHTYLLEEITCDGRDVFDGEGCDRTCYFFWKDKWLRKIS
jgi:hypothetical protein